MGIKKVARPMNKAKNAFVKWLKENKANNLVGLSDDPSYYGWDYYMVISGFIGGDQYTVYFMVWEGKESIDYIDEEHTYRKMSIDDFKSWDKHIEQVIELEKVKILERLQMTKEDEKKMKFQDSLPNFYSLKLDGYLTVPELEKVKSNLEKSDNILSIESFQSAYQSKYELFSFIKFAFQTFILFMSIISFFLIFSSTESDGD